MSRLRNFVFTWNNYSEEDKEYLAAFAKSYCKYMIFGEEVGEKNTPHLQGYCRLSSQRSFGKVKKWLPKCHIEKRQGTEEQAIVYCMKDGKYTVFGETEKKVKFPFRSSCNIFKIVNRHQFQYLLNETEWNDEIEKTLIQNLLLDDCVVKCSEPCMYCSTHE